ncbi:MAG: TonB-dependent hemoglobin/transferrin/lactoferrin family receptor [Gammaproteobacteria bacterium]|nr:TonB-dependent hemoglobin/transferrin/lactoferrin family receptor [Gammaproteobacteria bacterium]
MPQNNQTINKPRQRASLHRKRLFVKAKYSLAAMLGVLLLPLAAHSESAQEERAAQEDGDEQERIEHLIVVATRTERTANEVAATVSYKTAEALEAELAQDIADAVRYEPGVSVGGTGSRFGLSGFNIRGIDGNRVLTMVDGIRVADEFSFGPFLSARRDFVDIDSLSRLEIARGPVSSLYGSDALGGVVALRTKQPHDYLEESELASASIRTGYSSADDAYLASVGLAGQAGPFASLIRYTERSGHESDNSGSVGGTGSAREHPDPLTTDSANLVMKLDFEPFDAHRVSLTLDQYEHDLKSDILSDAGSVTYGNRVNSRRADDARSRERISLGYQFDGALLFADHIEATVYRQDSETYQLTTEDRTTARGSEQTRFRESTYDQRVEGMWGHLLKRFSTGAANHQLSVGMDYYATKSGSLRNGATTDSTGAPVREFAAFPTRDFPLTEVTALAAFVQDELSLFDGRLLLSPGIRWDRFEARARVDSVYREGNPGTAPPQDYDAEELTAKLGAIYKFNNVASVYARFAEGFRAPPYDDVNVGFTNVLGGYKTIANPELSSESSEGIELGARLTGDEAQLHVAVFRNEYKNFIESFAIAPAFLRSGGIDPGDGFRTFQSVNRGQVTIEGWEMSAFWTPHPRWQLRAAFAYAEGADQERDAPLNSVEPFNAVLGVGYSAPGDRWGARLIGTYSSDKDDSDIDSEDPRFPTDAYGVIDFHAYARIGERASVNLGVFNLTDANYIRWVDTAGIGSDAPARFSQPGINAAITFGFEI